MKHAQIRLGALSATIIAGVALTTPAAATDEGPIPCTGVVVITQGVGECPSAPRAHCMVLAGCQYLPEWAWCEPQGLGYQLTCAWES